VSSISRVLGISDYGLSATLSQTFSHTVTIVNETDITTTFAIQADKDTTVVWTAWQLVDVFAVTTDSTGKEIGYAGRVEWLLGMNPSISSIPNPNRVLHRQSNITADQVRFQTVNMEKSKLLSGTGKSIPNIFPTNAEYISNKHYCTSSAELRPRSAPASTGRKKAGPVIDRRR
jgi:hypothetical protein